MTRSRGRGDLSDAEILSRVKRRMIEKTKKRKRERKQKLLSLVKFRTRARLKAD